MTTTSYPAVGQNGLTETQWAVIFGDQDGIVQDYCPGGVTSCTMTRTGDIATIGVGKVKVNNYVLDITAAHDLSLPSVSVTTTYYIAVMYDPTLNVADGAGNADPNGPCRLVVTSGPPVTTGGKSYCTLYTVTRAPSQALTASTVLDCRIWQGPTLMLPALPTTAPTGFGPFSRGTTLLVAPAGGGGLFKQYVMDLVGSALAWRPLTVITAIAFPASSGLVANSGAPQFFPYAGCMIKCRGTLKRSSGTLSQSTTDITLGQFAAGFRPAFTERFPCKTGAGKNWIEVRVQPDGAVVMTGETGVDWIDLSPINFRAEN